MYDSAIVSAHFTHVRRRRIHHHRLAFDEVFAICLAIVVKKLRLRFRKEDFPVNVLFCRDAVTFDRQPHPLRHLVRIHAPRLFQRLRIVGRKQPFRQRVLAQLRHQPRREPHKPLFAEIRRIIPHLLRILRARHNLHLHRKRRARQIHPRPHLQRRILRRKRQIQHREHLRRAQLRPHLHILQRQRILVYTELRFSIRQLSCQRPPEPPADLLAIIPRQIPSFVAHPNASLSIFCIYYTPPRPRKVKHRKRRHKICKPSKN